MNLYLISPSLKKKPKSDEEDIYLGSSSSSKWSTVVPLGNSKGKYLDPDSKKRYREIDLSTLFSQGLDD
jgi:hypothetical protein